MSKDFSKPAFISWALAPLAFAAIVLQDEHGYISGFAAIIAPPIVLLAALLIGWSTQTLKESLLGTITGLFVVGMGIKVFVF